MKMWLALDTPCSDSQSEAAFVVWPQPCCVSLLAQEAHFFMKKNCLPGAELMGGVAAGATHQPVVLPFLGAAPETRGRTSAFHCVPVSNSSDI